MQLNSALIESFYYRRQHYNRIKISVEISASLNPLENDTTISISRKKK